MFETASDMSFKDNKSQAQGLNSQPVSLPTIPRKPASRGQGSARRQLSNQQKLVLPNIHQSQADITGLRQSQRDKENYQFKNKTAFARQVKQKLNFVLGEMAQIENNEVPHDDGDSDDDLDFQAKINQNKQLLKMHKQKKQIEKNNQLTHRQKLPTQSRAKKQLKSRNQSLYQKRVKQYREQSMQNKYLQKRKQTVKQQKSPTIQDQNNGQENLNKQYYRLKEDFSSKKEDKLFNKRSKEKIDNPRVLSHKSSQKNIAQISKNQDLFDNIQNYLQNPTQSKKQSTKPLVGLTLLKAKRDIEDKIKLINEKLGIMENQQQSNKGKIVMDPNASAKDWRRVQVNFRNIDCHLSNFDKELERVGSLQEKNSLNLQKYLQHQKILLQLEMRKGQIFRKNQANSH